MREKLIDLLFFLKSALVLDRGQTIKTNGDFTRNFSEYAHIIEKILSGDVILIDKNKLEKDFSKLNVRKEKFDALFYKDFSLRSGMHMDLVMKKDENSEAIYKWLNEGLTQQMLSHFQKEYKIDEEEGE